MNGEIYSALKENINNGQTRNERVRFVFHSETAAAFWARFSLREFGLKAIARDRFLAWDVFKAENLRVQAEDKNPVNRAIRHIFARKICAQNAVAPFFKNIIPAQFAKDGLLFAKSIADILPSLKFLTQAWRNTSAADGIYIDAGDLADYAMLEIRYEAFMREQKLFEPSWEKPPFKDTAHEYFIFYPELIEDFNEYEELLRSSNVHKISIGVQGKPNDSLSLLLYDTAQAELRAAALEIRALHFEQGIDWEDIALSSGELDVVEPYLKRVFSSYNIPFCIRSGKPVSRYNAGLFFDAVYNCVSSNFSWISIEALITNTALPWRTPNKHRALLRFGVLNNCVVSYHNTRGGNEKLHGKKRRKMYHDIWEEAFYGKKNKDRLRNHYKKLSAKARRIANAKTFEDLRKRTINFFAHFFLDAWPLGVSRILGRALKELSELSALEKKHPSLFEGGAPAQEGDNPLEFFLLILKEKIHVFDGGQNGVNVFDYGVAAGAPFAAHLIINANQKALTKLIRPLSFMRQDKRRELNIFDSDVSKCFIKSHNQMLRGGAQNIVRVSAAKEAFSGAQIPHSYFLQNIIDAAPPDIDIYIEEKNWWLGASGFPKKIFAPQKNNFLIWNFFTRYESFNKERQHLEMPFSSLKSPAPALLAKRIDKTRRTENKLIVSATTLKSFFFCPLHWLYSSIFRLKNYDTTAQLLNAEDRGILYHIILQKLFERIQKEDFVFNSAHIEFYNELAEEITSGETKTFKRFRGPLAVWLNSVMSRTINANIRRLLEDESKDFDGWSVDALEEDYSCSNDTFILTGKIDRVSASPEGIPLIFDYKTGTLPAKSACVIAADVSELEDFQIPVYIKLFEENHSVQVEYAAFIKANGDKKVFVVRPSGVYHISRQEYQNTIDALDKFIAIHVNAVNALDFSTRPIHSKCAQCIYKPLCRTI